MESKDKFKEMLDKIKEDESLVETYMEAFDEFFEKTKKDSPNINVLECMFTNFVSLAYEPTKTGLFLSSKLTEVENKLKEIFTDEQRRLFDIYEYVQNEYSNQYGLKAFVYGCLLSNAIKEEFSFFDIKTLMQHNSTRKNTLIHLVEHLSDKYSDQLNFIISEHQLTIEYIFYRNGEKDLYKTLLVEEFDHKFKVTIFPEKIERIIDVKGLEDILLILEKQSKVIEHTPEEIKYIRENYQKGTKIKLIKLYDLQAPEPGTIGEVAFVDDAGQIHMKWPSGSSLSLNVGVDEFQLLD